MLIAKLTIEDPAKTSLQQSLERVANQLYADKSRCADAHFGRANPPFNIVKRSNDRLSHIGACNTASSPPNINPIDKANAWLIYAAIGAKYSGEVHEGVSALRMF